MLHDHEKSILCFNDFIKLNNMWMPNNLKNMDFSSYSFNIIDIFYLPFVQYLDGHFLSSVNVESLFYFSECSLAKSLFYFVISDHFVSFFHVDVDLFFLWHQYFCYSSAFVNVFDFSIAVRLCKFTADSFLRCLLLIIKYAQVILLLNFLFFSFLINLQILKQKEHILRISWLYLRSLNSLFTILKPRMKKLIIRFIVVCVLNCIFI